MDLGGVVRIGVEAVTGQRVSGVGGGLSAASSRLRRGDNSSRGSGSGARRLGSRNALEVVLTNLDQYPCISRV